MDGITWLGHAGFKLKNGKTVYIDPFKVKDKSEKADIIICTHEHYDHCSIEDIKGLAKPDTIIVTVADNQSKLSGLTIGGIKLIAPGGKVSIGDVTIEAVPAYNVNKRFHPRENNWVGVLVTIGGKRIYHAGDTDRIPEMKNIKCDVALLPVSGTYVMTPEEAALAAADIKPKLAIPMHIGSIIGGRAEAERFKKLCTACPVEILG